MSVILTGTGGLYTRWGKLGGVVAGVNTFQSSTIPTAISGVVGQYASAEYMIDGISQQQTSNQTVNTALNSYLASLASFSLNEMVYADNPLSSRTSVFLSMKELIRQMKVSGDTVKACAIGLSSAAVTGQVGNGVIVGTTKELNGLVAENSFAETVQVRCVTDSASNSSIAGNEQFTASGQVGSSIPLDQNFPLGSGSSQSLSAINAAKDNSQGNLLTNSDFETWTVANVPDNWTIATGAAGTQVKQSTSQFYTGASSLNLAGDGSTQTALTQTFAVSTGTNAVLQPQGIYAVNFWIKADVVPAAGVLTVDLIDGSNTVIQDSQGNNNSFAVSLPGISTSWVAHDGVFILPHIMPSTIKLRLRLSTALTNTRNIYIDRLGMGTMTTLYQQGPSIAIFSGSSNFYSPDGWNVAVTNNRGGASNNKTFQTLVDRFLGMRSMGLLLPSAASPTLSDGLIA